MKRKPKPEVQQSIVQLDPEAIARSRRMEAAFDYDASLKRCEQFPLARVLAELEECTGKLERALEAQKRATLTLQTAGLNAEQRVPANQWLDKSTWLVLAYKDYLAALNKRKDELAATASGEMKAAYTSLSDQVKSASVALAEEVKASSDALTSAVLASAPKKLSQGEKLDRLRRDCHWSFAKLAASVEIDQKNVIGHIRHSNGITALTLQMYRNAFSKQLKREISIHELIEDL